MPYCTVADMISRYGQQDMILLSWREGAADGEINQPVIEQAIADATAEINGYIGGRYDLPLSQVPDVLVRHCCDIARYLMSGDRTPETVQKRYDSVISYLVKVGKGDLSLGLSQGCPTEPGETIAMIQADGQVFNRKNSKGFI
ncbi:gp436 family protein [Rheinheimera aquimaris]|uniref:gp436 family protein n=1 Tax=Rheinheimera aquimaris TaxID=412437 RepID=UPI001E5366A4|nr:DUF1320 domain-containing protein [Rheinheimera aquimaris]MCD1597865.1 DUF1320 domain-containing protein [Rheinheimera aquimaris]